MPQGSSAVRPTNGLYRFFTTTMMMMMMMTTTVIYDSQTGMMATILTIPRSEGDRDFV